MKTFTSAKGVRVVFGTMILSVVLGRGPALAQQVAQQASMKSMPVESATKIVPDVLGKPVSEALKILKKAALNKVAVEGARTKDAVVQAQMPKGGETVSRNAKVILKTVPRKIGPATGGPGVARRETPTDQHGGDVKAPPPGEARTTKDIPGKSRKAMSKRWDPGEFSPSSGALQRKSVKKPGEVIIAGSKLKDERVSGDQQADDKGGFLPRRKGKSGQKDRAPVSGKGLGGFVPLEPALALKTINPEGELTMTGIGTSQKTIAPDGELMMTGMGFSPDIITPEGELRMTGIREGTKVISPAGTLTMSGAGFSPRTIAPAGELKMMGTRP